jgi:hypothetical protein
MDADSGVLFKAQCTFPKIPDHPTKNDAIESLAKVNNIIAEFPFVTPACRSVALAGFMTVLDRCARPAPLFTVKAPSTRTGKSLLVNLAGILMDGTTVAGISQAKDEELEKRINSALVADNGLIAIDNINRELSSDLMCQAITEARVSVRLLGFTQQKEVQTTAVFFVNGNNIRLAKDLSSREMLCEMDSKWERPELRTFRIPRLKDYVMEHRGELVVAVLTMLRAWHVSREKLDLPQFGGFEIWTERVRKPLVWLGLPDPF